MMSVARLTTNFVNYVRLHVLCLMMPLWTLVQAFISCSLEYCNALLCGISDGLVQHLQSVQNAAARLVTGAGRREHITSVLRQLHWLPVRQ